ncbi:hypothetical protein R3W88_008409 [Solanum pinnatisectum]|uniref:Uncharacterized protein n=1 Tax=Solanum pinnatisectum TaxID=50273 RepID=A0AAV9M8U3_9SOLN|nr:hypothetical protein R3W88_008409 [Solanum pinnatisectum]
MANFEDNVMIALYWSGEIVTEMDGFRYNECVRMIVSMSISTNYVELIKLLHEKMWTDDENIQLDICGKYPCSFQEKMKLPLICVMMHMLKEAMKLRRRMNLQKMMERVKPLKVNPMKILEITSK